MPIKAMPGVQITLDETETLGDMLEETAELEQVVFLEGHTGSGQPAIEIVFRRKDGTRIAAITTLRLWRAMSVAFEARVSFCAERDKKASGN